MARVRGIKQPHPLGSVASRAGAVGVQPLTAASGVVTTGGGVKISALPAASAANSSDLLEVSQSGVSRRVTLGQITSSITYVGDAPPLAPVPGTLWWNSDLGELFVYYDDGDSVQWVSATPSGDTTYGVVDVRAFGAVGDGVADDTAAIQAAISSIVGLGGVVLFPAGTYLVTARATVVAPDDGCAFMLTAGNSNIVFKGAGKGVSIIKPKTNKVEIFTQNGATNLRYEGMTFDNSANGVLQNNPSSVSSPVPGGGVAGLGNTANAAIDQFTGADLTVIDCSFKAFTFGICYYGNYQDNTVLVGTLIVDGCWFDGCVQGVICNQPRNVHFTNSDYSNGIGSIDIGGGVAAGHGIYVTDRSGAYPDTITVSDLSGTNNANTNIRIRKGKTVTVTDCPHYLCVRGHDFENCNNLTMNNCSITMKLQTPSEDTGACGFQIVDCGSFVLSNCVIDCQGTSAYAIRILKDTNVQPWANKNGVIENITILHDLAGPTSDSHPWVSVLDQTDLTLRNLTGVLTANVAQSRRFIELAGASLRCHVVRPAKRSAAVGNPAGSNRLVTLQPTATDCTVEWSSFDVDLVTSDVVVDLGTNNRVMQSDTATIGTWTPAVTFATPGDFAMTNIVLQQGRWVRIGNFVWLICSLSFDANAYTTASGTMQLAGIPFPARGSGGLRSTAALGTHTKLNISGNDVGVWLDVGTTVCTFRQSVNNASGASLGIANVPPSTTGVGVWFNIMYEIEP